MYNFDSLLDRMAEDEHYDATTNAENIRAMLDKELAEFLSGIASCDYCPAASHRCNSQNCCSNWLNWLKKRA